MSSTTLREELQQQIYAPLEPQLIYLAVKLGIPELLRDGPQSSADLAQQAAVHAPSLYRVLRGMVVLGLLREDADTRFSLTAKGALLQRGLGSLTQNITPGSTPATSEAGRAH